MQQLRERVRSALRVNLRTAADPTRQHARTLQLCMQHVQITCMYLNYTSHNATTSCSNLEWCCSNNAYNAKTPKCVKFTKICAGILPAIYCKRSCECHVCALCLCMCVPKVSWCSCCRKCMRCAALHCTAWSSSLTSSKSVDLRCL
jgi:hypothetical protein